MILRATANFASEHITHYSAPITHLMNPLPHQPKYSFQQKPLSIEEELIMYRKHAEKASDAKNQNLAHRWTLAANAVESFIHYKKSPDQLSLIKDIPSAVNANSRALETQEIALYTTQSLEAIRMNNMELAKQLIADAESTKEAGIRYRHWASSAQEELLSLQYVKQHDADEMAAQYRINALRATQAGNKKIAQQWSEAACLAQEAAKKAWLGKSTYVITGNEILANRWTLSTNASHYSSQVRAKVALALEENNEKAANHHEEIALIAEDIATYRAKATQSTLDTKEVLASHWIMAASSASHALEAKINSMKAMRDNSEELVPYWQAIASAAQTASECRVHLAQSLERNKKRLAQQWLKAACSAENSLSDMTKALYAFKEKDLLSTERWKKSALLNEHACNMKMKAARSMSSWWWIGLPALYWNWKTENQVIGNE